MRGKSLLLLVLALGCGLVASIGITQVMAKRKAAPVGPVGETESIFVAMQDSPLGEPLNSQVLKLEQWPKGKVPDGCLTKIEDVEGRRTRTKLYAGEPILENKLFSKGSSEQGATALIPNGYRVVGVKVDSVSGGSSMILPGDRVDVLVHLRRNPASGILNTSTRTILQDVKVFAVNDQYGLDGDGDDEKAISAKTISLLVKPAQAETVMLATQLGQIQLTMRGGGDDEQVTVAGASPQELLGMTSETDRDAESLLPDSPKPTNNQTGPPGFLDFLKKSQAKHAGDVPPAVETPAMERGDTWPMRVMQGTEVGEVMLESLTHGSGVRQWRVVGPTSGNAVGGDLPGGLPSVPPSAADQPTPDQPTPDQPTPDQPTPDDSDPGDEPKDEPKDS